MENIKTKLHSYYLDVSKKEELEKYQSIKEKLKGVEVWTIHAPYTFDKKFDDFRKRLRACRENIEIETNCLFANQWNTAPIKNVSENGLRVHKWVEYVFPNKDIKEGYYLDFVPELTKALQDHSKCGYCGKQYYKPKIKFCTNCLDSQYLEKKQIHLLRLQPICNDDKPRKELTATEAKALLPKYKKAQLEGSTVRGKKRIAEKRQSLLKDKEKAIYAANTEFDGFTWLMDNGINTENCIYYSHTDIFSFGWRNPLDIEIATELKTMLKGFKFSYEIKEA